MSMKSKQRVPQNSVLLSLPAPVGNVKTKRGKKNRSKKNGGRPPQGGYGAVPGQIVRPSPPQISSLRGQGDGRVRVSHRELVAEIMGQANYTCSSYSVNPAIRLTFPWLGQFAKLYESYIFRSLQFEYVPSCPTTTSGTVMLAFDFDAFDSPPANKQGMMSSHLSVSGQPFQRIAIASDRQDLEKFGIQRFTRQSSLAANLDIKTYDVCNLFIATKGQAGPAEVGDLYVSYVIDLITPQDPIWLVDPADCSARIASSPSQSVAAPLDGATKIGDPRDDVVEVGPGGVLDFMNIGQYLLEFSQSGTGLNSGLPTLALISGIATLSGASGLFNAGSTQNFGRQIINVSKAPARVSVTSNGVATTIGATALRIAAYFASNG